MYKFLILPVFHKCAMANTQHLLSGFILLQQRTVSIAMTTPALMIKMATDLVTTPPAMAAPEMALLSSPSSPAACGKVSVCNIL